MAGLGQPGYLAPGRPPQDKMRNGYAQNTKEFGKLLRYSKPVDRILRYCSVQSMWFYRKNQRRSRGPGPHTADLVRVEKILPGGRRKDRMEYRVVAYGRHATQEEWPNKQHTLAKSLIYISGGRTISRSGKVVGGPSTIVGD